MAAVIPQHFLRIFAGRISPLIHSTRCSILEPTLQSRAIFFSNRSVCSTNGSHLQPHLLCRTNPALPSLNHQPWVPGCHDRMSHLFSTSSHSSEGAPIQEVANDEPEDSLYKWIELRVKGHDDAVLESYATYVSLAANELDVTLESIAKPFRQIRRLTLLKSRHIYKKHRVQYEMRTYYRVIRLKHVTGSTASILLEYIERNLPEGVAMQVKKCSVHRMPQHLHSPPEQLEDDLDFSSSSSSSESSSDSDNETGNASK